eukprot:Awhi_evm1s15510
MAMEEDVLDSSCGDHTFSSTCSQEPKKNSPDLHSPPSLFSSSISHQERENVILTQTPPSTPQKRTNNLTSPHQFNEKAFGEFFSNRPSSKKKPALIQQKLSLVAPKKVLDSSPSPPSSLLLSTVSHSPQTHFESSLFAKDNSYRDNQRTSAFSPMKRAACNSTSPTRKDNKRKKVLNSLSIHEMLLQSAAIRSSSSISTSSPSIVASVTNPSNLRFSTNIEEMLLETVSEQPVNRRETASSSSSLSSSSHKIRSLKGIGTSFVAPKQTYTSTSGTSQPPLLFSTP